MNISTRKYLKAVSKKRARGEPSGSQRAPAPKRPMTGTSEPPAGPELPVPPEIDLTADTPPGEAAITRGPTEEVAAEGPAMEEPIIEGPTAATEPVSVAPSRLSPPEAPGSWGEGPSEAASPPQEQALASSPAVESENDRGTEGRGIRSGSPRDPLQVDGRWAEQILSPAFAPEVLEALGQLTAGTFFRESFANLIKLACSLKAAKEALHECKALVRESRREADEARARAMAAEEALASAMTVQAEELAAAERALAAARTARAEEIKAAEDRAEIEIQRRHAALLQMSIAQDAVAARDLRISELTLAVEEAEGRATATLEGARVAEERSRAAEEEASRAREAESVAVAALAAEEGARAVRVETAVAARTAGIIEEYKASGRFEDDLVKASTAAFLQGFEHGKEKIARDFNFPQALEIEPDRCDSSDDESASSGP